MSEKRVGEIYNLLYFYAKFTCAYMRRLLNFGGIYYVIKNIISFIHDLYNKRFMVDWINNLVYFNQQEINNQLKTRGFLQSLYLFHAKFTSPYMREIIIYFKGEDFMRTFLSIALLVYLIMSVISVGYSIWWLSVVAKEMKKANKTINEINDTQIK